MRAIESSSKGLFIYDKWDWSIRYPVIHISFTEGELGNRKELDEKILELLNRNQKRLQSGCEYRSISGCFSELIEKARKRYGQPVVILIDEYDKPILDNINDIEIAREMRE